MPKTIHCYSSIYLPLSAECEESSLCNLMSPSASGFHGVFLRQLLIKAILVEWKKTPLIIIKNTDYNNTIIFGF